MNSVFHIASPTQVPIVSNHFQSDKFNRVWTADRGCAAQWVQSGGIRQSSMPRPRGTFRISSTMLMPATSFTLTVGKQGNPEKQQQGSCSLGTIHVLFHMLFLDDCLWLLIFWAGFVSHHSRTIFPTRFANGNFPLSRFVSGDCRKYIVHRPKSLNSDISFPTRLPPPWRLSRRDRRYGMILAPASKGAVICPKGGVCTRGEVPK